MSNSTFDMIIITPSLSYNRFHASWSVTSIKHRLQSMSYILFDKHLLWNSCCISCQIRILYKSPSHMAIPSAKLAAFIISWLASIPPSGGFTQIMVYLMYCLVKIFVIYIIKRNFLYSQHSTSMFTCLPYWTLLS